MADGPQDAADAIARLDAITRRLRRECPWDREQDERSIVPHTVEEAYELADAADRRDDAKLLDELGDVLFQVHFLALLLEERGAGSLSQVAEHVTEKLIRRHPHVFGEVQAPTAPDVLRNWDAIKREEPGREPGLFGEVPENLPSLLHARKVQRRAASRGLRLPRRRGPARSRSARSSPSSRPQMAARSASTSSATCCSRRSTWPASSSSIQSSRCAPRRDGSGRGCSPRPSRRHPRAGVGTISRLTSSSPTTPAHG